MKRTWILVVLILLLAVLAGCGAQPTEAPPENTPTLAEPTPSPTPAPPRAVLVVPEGADPAAASQVNDRLVQLGTEAGLSVDRLNALQPGEVTSEVRVVVFLSPPADLSAFLSSAPQTQFIVISSQDLPQAPNLSVIRTRAEDLAFLGGYTAAILAPDWRVLALLDSSAPDAASFQQAFSNGFAYWCGVCVVSSPPFISFPLVASQPGGDPTAWQGAVDSQKANNPMLLFLGPGVLSDDLAAWIAGQNRLMFGAGAPPESARSTWAGTLGFDLAASLAGLWPEVLSGTGGKTVSAALTITNIQPGILTDGRFRLVREMADELAAGRIQPFNVP